MRLFAIAVFVVASVTPVFAQQPGTKAAPTYPDLQVKAQMVTSKGEKIDDEKKMSEAALACIKNQTTQLAGTVQSGAGREAIRTKGVKKVLINLYLENKTADPKINGDTLELYPQLFVITNPETKEKKAFCGSNTHEQICTTLSLKCPPTTVPVKKPPAKKAMN